MKSVFKTKHQLSVKIEGSISNEHEWDKNSPYLNHFWFHRNCNWNLLENAIVVGWSIKCENIYFFFLAYIGGCRCGSISNFLFLIAIAKTIRIELNNKRDENHTAVHTHTASCTIGQIYGCEHRKKRNCIIYRLCSC